ncbi:cation:proton antiporter [Salinigranum salinum]|uniref:cation:proton antiporter n=1 Tax=Salinigranum salinum TaxID=1364937 RepID=UPI00126066DF|nr:cation:proton antiporter [Salinigranum salinum]
MASAPDASLLLVEQLFVVLVLAHLFGFVTERLGLTAVVGELATGFVLGPSVLGLAFPSLYADLFPGTSGPLLDGVASVGLVLLLVVAGLEIDLGLVRRHATTTAAVGVFGMVVPFGLGFLFGWALPAALRGPSTDRLVFGLFVATALSISAIPVVTRILLDLRLLGTELGQMLVAAAVLTDVLGWLVLGVVVQAAREGSIAPASALRSVVVLAAFVAGALVVGRLVVPGAVSRLPALGTTNRQVGVVVAAGLGTSALALAVGLEAFLGAFLLGVVLSRAGGLPTAVEERFESVTVSVFAPLFFGVAGLRADLTALADPTVIVVGAVAVGVALVGKFAGVFAGAVLVGRSRGEALVLGAGLNARGAIEIILATIGFELGILSTELYTVILGVAVVTSAMAPPLLKWSFDRLGTASTGHDA